MLAQRPVQHAVAEREQAALVVPERIGGRLRDRVEHAARVQIGKGNALAAAGIAGGHDQEAVVGNESADQAALGAGRIEHQRAQGAAGGKANKLQFLAVEARRQRLTVRGETWQGHRMMRRVQDLPAGAQVPQAQHVIQSLLSRNSSCGWNEQTVPNVVCPSSTSVLARPVMSTM